MQGHEIHASATTITTFTKITTPTMNFVVVAVVVVFVLFRDRCQYPACLLTTFNSFLPASYRRRFSVNKSVITTQ